MKHRWRKTVLVLGCVLALAAAALVLWRGVSAGVGSARISTSPQAAARKVALAATQPRDSEPATVGDSGPMEDEGEPIPFPADSPMLTFYEKGLGNLTAEQLAKYLQEAGESAESLLVVARLSDDLAKLREAAVKFPDDPQIQLELVWRSDSPEERAQAAEAFRRLAPENALGDYLAALDSANEGDLEGALKAIAQGNGKGGLDSYERELRLSMEEAFLSAGATPAEAKIGAVYKLQHGPHQTVAKVMRHAVLNARSLQEAGDPEAAARIRNAGLQMAYVVQDQFHNATDEVVAGTMEAALLKQLPPDTMLEGGTQTAGERVAELKRYKEELNTLINKGLEMTHTMTARETMLYLDRWNMYGEIEAMRWLNERRAATAKKK